ncbi:cytochrome c biogenesis protein ResB [Galactobacter caseinivorans]|uniref:Cytochrome c biogenesis protein ResB n=2 Tax=Galactobacter caseinivorans TaxID=2676123 RepID=A0A496PN32_9MICC|nr:cytochrome c biogenesis protein ResB [Galactobacter caseinivorans]
MLRWAWTQLTTMKTALFLLLLVAVAAVPGSLFPQREASPEKVAQYLRDNEFWGPVLDKLQFFEVFSSVWFSAIYILLFISLVGCVLPRTKQHFQASRRPPARTPARFTRLPESGVLELPADAEAGQNDEVLRRVAKLLKRRRYRVSVRPAEGRMGASVAAERGYLREWGNLVFHYSLVGVLVSVAVGGLFGFTGQRYLVEGQGFTNTLIAYDQFNPGHRFDAESLSPFTVKLDDFHVTFNRQERTDGKYGTPVGFDAKVQVKDSATSEWKAEDLQVNHPLRVNGTDLYLVGNGYAPVITVKDGKGDVVFSEPVVTVAQDGMYNSLLVLKIPDSNPDQLAFQGFFLPTTTINANGAATSSDPDALLPSLYLNSFYGDLGLDSGKPQNVFSLDTDKLNKLNDRKLDAGGIVLGREPGENVYTLPEGKGTISFDGVKRYIGLQVRHDPGKAWVGGFAALATVGLAISLFIPRRRVWVKLSDGPAGENPGTRSIEYGLLARGEDPRLTAEAKALREQLMKEFPGLTPVEITSADNGAVRTLRD